MDVLTTLADGFANVASGGLFGLFGAVAGAIAKHFQERQRQEWAREQWGHEERLLELQMRSRVQETEAELAIVSQQGAWAGLTASLTADAAGGAGAPGWVNAVRSLYRPALTSGLLVLVYLLWRDMLAGLDGEGAPLAALFSGGEIKDLLRYIVNSVVFAASTAVVWWFGDRALQPPHARHR